MKYLFLLLLISAIAFISCSSEKDYPVKITEENGVKTVSNPDYPKEGVYDLVLDELFTLGKDEDNSKYIFARYLFIDIDNRFNLYVYDSEGCKIFKFDKAGNYVSQFGRHGQGPGDFGQFVIFRVSPDDKIIINDLFNRRICWFDLNGNYLDGLIYRDQLSFINLDSKGNIYCVKESYDNIDKLTDQPQFIASTKSILRFNLKTNEWDTVGSFRGEKHRMLIDKRGGYSSHGPYNEFIWNISPDNLLFTGFADTYELSVYDLKGKLKYKFNRKFTPSLNPAFGERKQPQYLRALNQFSLFDNNGNYWSALDYGGLPEYYIYEIFSKDGVFLKKVYSKYQIRLIKEDKAYSIVYSKTDPVYVKAFKYSLKKREK